MPLLLKVDEVAQVLRAPRSRVYSLVEGGAFPHLRISNSIRVRAQDLATYLGVQVEDLAALLSGPVPERPRLRSQASVRPDKRDKG